MDVLLSLASGVPWQQWAILAAASWAFALVCFIGYYRTRPTSKSASVAYLQLVQHPRPDDLAVEHDRIYPRRRAA
ncbi:MAG: hypothetical protein HY873_11330 [Chloroflexi bacterium]|nr:hypothetical protein [Chloroflexota bacterium]